MSEMMPRGATMRAPGSLQLPTPAAMNRPAANLPPIHTVRGQRVVLDTDLAALYGVTTKVFNQTIRRNAGRFPPDFIFQLTVEEFAHLKSQIVISNPEGHKPQRSQFVTLKTAGRGRHRKYLPLAFTEHGAIMAATILRSPCAGDPAITVPPGGRIALTARPFRRLVQSSLSIRYARRRAHKPPHKPATACGMFFVGGSVG